jgi:hypothetical protein
MTTTLEGGEWSTARHGRFTPGKDPVSIYRRLGGPQGRSGQVQKISPPPGFDPWTVQSVASRYTVYATRPTKKKGIVPWNQSFHVIQSRILFRCHWYETYVSVWTKTTVKPLLDVSSCWLRNFSLDIFHLTQFQRNLLWCLDIWFVDWG